MFTFFVLDQRHPLKKFSANNKNCHFKLKFAAKTNTNLNIQNSFVVFTFDRKYLFWGNLVRKTKLLLKSDICT